MNILILAGAGASWHAGYPCGDDLSGTIWAAVGPHLLSLPSHATVLVQQQVDDGSPQWVEVPFTPAPQEPLALDEVRGDVEMMERVLEPLKDARANRAWRVLGTLTHSAPRFLKGVGSDFELLNDVVEQAGAGWARQALRQAIVDSLGIAPGANGRGEAWRLAWPALLDPLAAAGHAVSIFTPNYDPLFEHLRDFLERQRNHHAALLDTGVRIERQGTSPYPVAYPLEPTGAASSWEQADGLVPVVYLHGCAAWEELKDPGDFCVTLKFERGKAVTTDAESALLWPGRGKVPDRRPFREAYAALAKASRSAHIVLIIGSRLQDPALWASLLLTAADRADPPQIALVDARRPEEVPKGEHPKDKLLPNLDAKCYPIYDGFNADTAEQLADWIAQQQPASAGPTNEVP